MCSHEKFTDIDSARERAKSLMQTAIDIGFREQEVYLYRPDERTEVFSVARSGRIARVTRGEWLPDREGRVVAKKEMPCVVVR